MIKKTFLFIILLFNVCYGNVPNCQKLWDMNNRINGIEIYKMGLYACIEGPPPNLRGSIPELISPNITILNNSQNLSNNISIDPIEQQSFNNTQINNTIIQATLTTTKPPITTTTINTTMSQNEGNNTNLPPILNTPTSNITNNNSHIDFFNHLSKNNIESPKISIITTTHIIIISIVSTMCCCGILTFFIHKAHIKSKKKTTEPNKITNDVENNKLKVGQLTNAVYYSNKLRNKLGNRSGREKGFKNRNSWSKDNRIQPEKKGLPPKLPEPNIKVSVNTYKNKKPGLSLNTQSEKKTRFQIKEIIENKKHSSFVPGSPRRRLPTPPHRAPPPPAPEFASKSLASKLDSMANSKISPKIQRIVQKNK
jgi:hypothetical protein